jgi:outer membrane cobalamin receptor
MKILDYRFLAIFIAFFSLSVTADNPGDEADASSESVVAESNMSSSETSDETSSADASDVEDVVVTGTRFGVSQYKSSQPITIITADDIRVQGYTNAASAVFDLPSVFASASTAGDQDALVAGQRIANNFGLGSGRTLTLVDGKRFISSQSIQGGSASTGSVDLNNIPLTLIKRIEVQSSGGSAMYGSDAIAGVINYVLDREYEGFEIGLDTSRPYYGDSSGISPTNTVSLTFGASFDDGKGHVAVAMQHNRQPEIAVGQVDGLRDCENRVIRTRTFADGKTYQNGYYDGSMVWPNGTDIQSNVGMCTTLDLLPFEGGTFDAQNFSRRLVDWNVGAYDAQYLFDSAGNLVPHERGTSYGNFAFRYGGNQMASDNNETLLAKSERNALSVFTTYQISDNTRLKIDVFANRSGSEESGDDTGGPYLYDGFGGDLDGGYYNYPFFECGHPYMSAATTAKCNSLWPSVPSNIGAAVNWAAGDAYRAADGTVQDVTADMVGTASWTGSFDPVTGLYIQTPVVVTDPYAGRRGFLVGKTVRDLFDDPRGPVNKGNQDLLSYTVAFDGTFEMANKEFQWEAGLTNGTVDLRGENQDINRGRMVTALDTGINPATGEVDCKMNYVADYIGLTYGAANPWDSAIYHPNTFGSVGIPGDCIPYNPFGYNPNSPAGEYIMMDEIILAQNSQTIKFAEVQGTVYDLPSGPVQLALGISDRQETLKYDTPSIQEHRLGRSAVAGYNDNQGSYTSEEYYGELSLPLVNESMGLTYMGWGIQDLRVDAAYRNIENSFSGDYSVESANLYWQVSDSLSIRGGTQTAVRTPDLTDVFGPQSPAYRSASDPCHVLYIDDGVDPTQRRANCEAEPWYVDGWESQIVNKTAEGRSGGNPNLLNELGDTMSYGVIFTPDFDLLPGDFTMSIDFVQIEMTDVVDSFTLSQNMNACYDYAVQEDKYCNTFTRVMDPAGEGAFNYGDVNDFLLAVNNVGVRNFETYIYNFDYNQETAYGDFSVRFRGYNQQLFESAPTANPDDLVDYTGQASEPEWIYDVLVGLQRDKFGVFYKVDGQSGGYINILQDFETRPDQYIGLDGDPITEFDGYWLDSMAITYTPQDNTFVSLNISNPFGLDGTESNRFDRERGINLYQTVSLSLRHKF